MSRAAVISGGGGVCSLLAFPPPHPRSHYLRKAFGVSHPSRPPLSPRREGVGAERKAKSKNRREGLKEEEMGEKENDRLWEGRIEMGHTRKVDKERRKVQIMGE